MRAAVHALVCRATGQHKAENNCNGDIFAHGEPFPSLAFRLQNIGGSQESRILKKPLLVAPVCSQIFL